MDVKVRKGAMGVEGAGEESRDSCMVESSSSMRNVQVSLLVGWLIKYIRFRTVLIYTHT